MMTKKSKWVLKQPNPELAKKIGDELKLHPLCANVLCNRGIENSEQATRFLKPDVNALLEVEVHVHSSGLRRKLLIQGNASALSREDAEKRMEALQYLKQNPRDEEPNRLVLLRGERLYEEAIGQDRGAINRAMMEFDRALKSQDRSKIRIAREKLEKFLDEMEFGS